jgi:hypothetical protein
MSIVDWFRDEIKKQEAASEEKRENLAVAILIGSARISEGLLQVAAAIRGFSPGPPPRATKLELRYLRRGDPFLHYILQGKEDSMSQVIPNATVGQIYDPTVVESNATTPSIPPVGALVYATDNAAVATVDPATGVATMVSAGTANISVMDQGDKLMDTVAFTVAAAPPPPPPAADKLTLNYSLAPPVQAAEPSRSFGR